MIRRLLVAGCVLALATAASAAPKAPPARAQPGPAAADWRTPDPENVLVLDTSKGRVLVEMVPILAPAHVARVRELTRAGLYDGRKFFRVIDEFMAQTGDPQDNGQGGSDKPDLASEFSFRRGADSGMLVTASQGGSELGFIGPVPVASQNSAMMALTADAKVTAWTLYCPGVAAMARAGDPNSANSQFFLMRAAYPSLEKRYTAWGRVISGQPAVRALKVGEPPTEPMDTILKARILADIPAAERPQVRVVDANSAWFKAEIERVRSQRGADFSPCDVNIPAEVK
jgi:peptidylprolyl isomerase